MNLTRLYEILRECTVQLRKGDMVHGAPHLVAAIKEGRPLHKEPGGVVVIDAMPHESEAEGVEKVDLHFLVIGVDKAKATARRQELIDLLKTYPHPERLAGGPSYIEVGGEIGDQGAAFQLFALGKVLGLWDIVLPSSFGFEGAEADQMAGRGYIMMIGFHGSAP